MEIIQLANMVTVKDMAISVMEVMAVMAMASIMENMVLMDIMEQRKKGRQTIVAV